MVAWRGDADGPKGTEFEEAEAGKVDRADLEGKEGLWRGLWKGEGE